jgi:hypothetical protein
MQTLKVGFTCVHSWTFKQHVIICVSRMIIYTHNKCITFPHKIDINQDCILFVLFVEEVYDIKAI